MSDFLMPSLGADMDEAVLVEWQVKAGDTVHRGDVIAVVETAKGAIEVEVFEEGVVEELYVPVDTTVPVGSPIARLATQASVTPARQSPAEPEAAPNASVEADRQPEPSAEPAVEVSTRAEKNDRITQTPTTPPERLKASPLARQRAVQSGQSLAGVTGSGPQGAILVGDLSSTAQQAPATAEPKVEKSHAGFNPVEMRKAIAAAMARSKREIPHYYLATAVDMLTSTHWLDAYNANQPPEKRLLMSALIFKAVANALRDFPEMNGYFQEGTYQPSPSVNLGIAINLRGAGLMTPALIDADKLNLAELMTNLQDLTRRARQGGLRSSEMTRATITITALGERGVDSVYGVIYPPQVAILGFGKVSSRPWAIGDALAVRPVMQATLAADHRVSDGHRGGLFLDRINQTLQDPEQLNQPAHQEPES